MRPEFVRRFMASFRHAESGCWLWTAGRTSKYGTIWLRGRHMRANRAAWLLMVGPIPRGMHVLHTCDTPRCVNPSHLWLGTHADNMKDMAAKGRAGTHKPRRGSQVWNAKLHERDIKAIRLDQRAQHLIAADYGVQQMTISNIKRRKAWAHV